MFIQPEELGFDLANLIERVTSEWANTRADKAIKLDPESLEDFITFEMDLRHLRQEEPDGNVTFSASASEPEFQEAAIAGLDRWLRDEKRRRGLMTSCDNNIGMLHPPKDNPPQWLEVGDESWGPTDIRKRKPRLLYRPALPPRLPYRTGTGSKLSFRAIAMVLLLVVPAFFGAYWLQKLTQIDSPFIHFVGMFAGIVFGAGVIVGISRHIRPTHKRQRSGSSTSDLRR